MARNLSRSFPLALLGFGIAAIVAPPAVAQGQKVTLKLRAVAGQTKRSQATVNFSGDFQGNKFTRESKDVSKTTFTAVAANGDITFEGKTESSESTFNGEKAEDDEPDKTTDTFVVRPNGTLASFKTDDSEKDEDHTNERLFIATQIVFPDKPVGTGDKWTHEYKSDATLGTKNGTGEFEVLALEQKGGVPCAKIKLAFRETEGKNPVTCNGTVWVELASGDDVASELELPNFSPTDDGPTLTGTIKAARLDGGPLTADIIKTVLATMPDALKAVQTPATTPAGGGAATTTVQAGPPKPKDKTIDDIVQEKGKEYEKLAGLVTLWRKKENGKDTIYAEVKEDQLNKLMYLQATAATGTTEQKLDDLPLTAGTPFRDLVFQFVKSPDDKLYLAVPNTTYRAKKGSPIEKAIQRSYSDSYIQAFKIEAKQADRKSVLIDVSELFKGDLPQITSAFSGGGSPFSLGGSAPMGLDREKTYVTGIKNFPGNLVVNTQYAFARGSVRGAENGQLADPRGAVIQVTYNLSALPVNNGYVPRLFDSRVGYFTTGYVDFDSDRKEDLTTELILRWDIRKSDPTAKVSEAEKPIVFWIDNATPLEYRKAVAEGVLVWNKAFERIGILNAIQVKQLPDNPDSKAVAEGKIPGDLGDTRFNFIRWVISEDAGYAVALFRPNPLTGQILNASINVDGSLVQYFNVERNDIVEPAAAFSRAAYSGAEKRALLGALTPLRGDERHGSVADLLSCRMGSERRREAAFGWQALSLLGGGRVGPGSKLDPTEYARQLIRETVAHEFGHILGLRHNFVASTQFSLDQLANEKIVGQGGIGASVMDYNSFNIAALKKPGVDFFAQTIGTYDYWAVEYGYKPAPKSVIKPADEKPFLATIARRAGSPGLSWLSDEASFSGFDPAVTTYDLSADPLSYWEEVLKTSQASILTLGKRLPKNGESYWEFTRAFNVLLNQYSRAAGQVSRYVGASTLSNVNRGDAGERPVLAPTDVAKQRRAVAILNKYLFSPTGLTVPREYFTKFTAKPGDIPGNFPIGDNLANLEKSALRRVLSGGTLAKIANNEFKINDPAKSLTLPELFGTIQTNIWAEAKSGSNVPTLRRQLQRQHLELLTGMVLGGNAPDDARMLARAGLKSLAGVLTVAANKPGLDTYSRLHYGETLGKIERTLSAKQTIGGGGDGGGAQSLLQLLGGKAN